MNQIQKNIYKDYTYRLDAVESTCNSYGVQSIECEQAKEIWQMQHDHNSLMLKYSSISSFVGSVIVFILSLFIISMVALKLYVWQAELKERIARNQKKLDKEK